MPSFASRQGAVDHSIRSGRELVKLRTRISNRNCRNSQWASLELAQLLSGCAARRLPKFELLLRFALLSKSAEPLKVTLYPTISIDPCPFFLGSEFFFKFQFRPEHSHFSRLARYREIASDETVTRF